MHAKVHLLIANDKHYNTLMISIEGKRQDQDTLMKANNRNADITHIIVRQVSRTKRCWPSQSACCIITYTVHPGLDIVGNKVII